MAIIREGYWEFKHYSRFAGKFYDMAFYKDPVLACQAVNMKAWVIENNKAVPYSPDRHKDRMRVECGAPHAAMEPYYAVFLIMPYSCPKNCSGNWN